MGAWKADSPVDGHLERLSVLVVLQPHLNLAAVSYSRRRVLPHPHPHGLHGDQQVLHGAIWRRRFLLRGVRFGHNGTRFLAVSCWFGFRGHVGFFRRARFLFWWCQIFGSLLLLFR